MTALDRGLHVGETGTTIELTVVNKDDVAIDISGASTKVFRVEKPDETAADWTAVFTTDGTDGKVEFVTLGGSIDQVGPWKLQVLLTFPSAYNPSSIYYFPVYEVLSAP